MKQIIIVLVFLSSTALCAEAKFDWTKRDKEKALLVAAELDSKISRIYGRLATAKQEDQAKLFKELSDLYLDRAAAMRKLASLESK